MRRTAFAALAVLAILGCHHHGPSTPSKPSAAPATPPPAPPPSSTTETITTQQDEYSHIKSLSVDDIERLGLLAEIHFDFDRSELREPDRRLLDKDADVMKRYDFLVVTIGGHCDERGTVEYNLALGERRSRAAFDYLISKGVAATRLKTVSYGKEVPLCRESSEECWARNRRDHFGVTGVSGVR
jgi:peptidoglycan-associated lipoprotein